jgi:hypothetical protein
VSTDPMDFLENKEAEEVTAAPEPEQAAPAEETPEPKGETQAEPAPSAPPAPELEPTRVPITALLDEREKRQAVEAEAKQLKRMLDEIKAQQTPQKAPDIYEDPEGFIRQTQATMQQALWNERLNMSEAIARTQHGDEQVEKARDAFAQAVQSSPALYAEMRQHPNPYAYVVNWHKRQSILSEIGNDPDKWKQSQIEALREQVRQELLAQSSPKPAAPPPSLSKAPSRGNDAIAPGNAFDSMFPG